MVSKNVLAGETRLVSTIQPSRRCQYLLQACNSSASSGICHFGGMPVLSGSR